MLKANNLDHEIEEFETTADIGVRIRARSLNALFELSGIAMLSLVTDLSQVSDSEVFHVELESESLNDLMFDWLNTLIAMHEIENALFSNFKVRINEGRCYLNARIKGETINLRKHHIEKGIKAATYHKLKVEHQNNTWFAQVIFDI